ncbi:MAG: ABC transporter ATP-binding protein [Roseburia sp.]
MIVIDHLVKKYGNHVAVDDLSLNVEPGKIYGFLGPNGAGKSTTMNIITGYLGATSGTVKINGYDIFSQPEEAKKCVGYLPELPPLYMDMTVKEYLDFVAELKKLEKSVRAKYVEEAMELTKIADVSHRLIRNLSKGYRQRVGFAQAVLGYPEVIILDEPTVGLDPKQIIEIRELIQELGKKHTVILSSHILTEISAVCDHVFIISKGKLVASDSTENLVKLMAGAQEVQLVVKGEAEEVQKSMLQIAEVEKCELLEAEEEKTTRLNIIAKKEADVREQVFRTCVNHHFSILEMQTVTKSLEDVFLELTTKEGDKKYVGNI